MKRRFYFFLIILILWAIETAAFKVFLGASHFVPQLILLFTIVFSLHQSFREVVWFSFATGLLQETFSGGQFGAFIFAYLISAISVYFLTRYLAAEALTIPTVFLLILVATCLVPLIIQIYSYAFQLSGISGSTVRWSWTILWTVVINFAFFWPLNLFYTVFLEEGE